MNIPYTDDIEFGPVVLTYSFKPGQNLPEIGDVIQDERCSMVVTESNKEKGFIKVLLTTVETVASRMERYQREVEESIQDIACLIYQGTTNGMTALIGWGNLTDEQREVYLDLSRSIIDHLNKSKLLILQYEPTEE